MTLTETNERNLALLAMAWASAKTQQLETENGTASSGPIEDMHIDVERAYWACAVAKAEADLYVAASAAMPGAVAA